MTTPDTSVVVAAFARWHEQHEAARAAVREAEALVAPVAVESFSVLTRLPPPHRASPEIVVAFLDHHFPRPFLLLDAEGFRRLLDTAMERRILGGRIYDALVAVTAAAAGATLVSLDERAASTYAALACPYRLL
ncbi:MAG: VapC toxin family PIN domain ribonuclease [Thermoleophilia bacterium]